MDTIKQALFTILQNTLPDAFLSEATQIPPSGISLLEPETRSTTTWEAGSQVAGSDHLTCFLGTRIAAPHALKSQTSYPKASSKVVRT